MLTWSPDPNPLRDALLTASFFALCVACAGSFALWSALH